MKPRGQLLSTNSFSLRGTVLRLKEFLFNIATSLKSRFSTFGRRNTPQVFGENREKLSFKKLAPYVVFGTFAIIALAAIFSVTYFVFKSVSAGGKIEVLKPKATEELNREFSFPLFGADGAEVTRFKYVIAKAELRDEIIVDGKRARSVSGRTFLVLNVNISNDYNLPMRINSKDYVRLIVAGNTEDPFAADAHSDPIEVQPISTEQTILGFAINDNEKELILKVGEINGEKQEIKLSL